MSDPQRLAELERQRTLVASHLKWLDDEIARQRRPSDGSRAPMPGPPPAPPPVSRVHSISETDAAHPADPSSSEVEVVPLITPDPLPSKWGCWTSFIGVMLAIGAAVGLYVYFRYAATP